jgi:dephospho-CoA kinase
MMKVGLTGNMGSGKSTVAEIFSVLGVPVYRADEASKGFLPDPSIVREIVSFFGKDILDEEERIDRKKLGLIVFADQQKLSVLNSILHPRVRDDFRSWCKQYESHPYIIHEAAIIFESGFEKEFDRIIHVSCPKETAIGRIMRRDGHTREAILDRMRFQWEDEKKASLSDFVIRNGGPELVIPQVLAIHRELSEGRA